MRTTHRRALALLEVAAAAAVIVLDLLVPTLVVLAVAAVSLGVRRERPRSIGFTRLASPVRTAGVVLALTAGWSVLQFGLVMPVLNRVTDSRQDMTVFADLQHNVPLLAGLLVASWTLAALGEETVFRAYLPTRLSEAFGTARLGLVLSVLVPALLFALIHSEQGRVGMVVTFLDALYFSWLRHRFGSAWASVLGHGFVNTLGVLTFFVVGPVYGLW